MSMMALSVKRCTNILNNLHHVTTLSVRGGKKYRKKVALKSSASIPKGGPVPPDHETVAYVPIPWHLTPEGWSTRGSKATKSPKLWHEDWRMQRDARKRALCVLHGPLRARLNCLRHNGFLPLEMKQLADQEISCLPKQSDYASCNNRCILTGRPRGNKKRWRISRMMFRNFADHGLMSGIMRGKW